MPNQKNETKEPKTQKTPKDKVIDASVRGKSRPPRSTVIIRIGNGSRRRKRLRR